VYLSKSTVLGSLLIILLTVFGAVVTIQLPTLSVAGVIISTPIFVGLIGGLLLAVLLISHYRFEGTREWTGLVLFGVGIILALTQRPPFNWLGVLAIFLSLAVEWEVDRHLFRVVSR